MSLLFSRNFENVQIPLSTIQRNDDTFQLIVSPTCKAAFVRSVSDSKPRRQKAENDCSEATIKH